MSLLSITKYVIAQILSGVVGGGPQSGGSSKNGVIMGHILFKLNDIRHLTTFGSGKIAVRPAR